VVRETSVNRDQCDTSKKHDNYSAESRADGQHGDGDPRPYEVKLFLEG
jgi:hypothetical protein